MNCLLLSRYGRLGASSRMRFYQFLPFLESQQIHVDTAALLDDSYVRNLNSGKSAAWTSILGSYVRRVRSLASSSRFDLVWVEAEVFPWLPDWAELWLSRRHIPYVVDYDDAAFHRYDLHRAVLVRWVLGRKIDRIMKQAALVIAGNSYLANRARQAGAARIEILPTVVDVRSLSRAHIQTKRRVCHWLDWISDDLALLDASARCIAASNKLGANFLTIGGFR